MHRYGSLINISPSAIDHRWGDVLPYLGQDHGRESGLHEEALGLGPGDEAIDGGDGGELLGMSCPLQRGDGPGIHGTRSIGTPRGRTTCLDSQDQIIYA